MDLRLIIFKIIILRLRRHRGRTYRASYCLLPCFLLIPGILYTPFVFDFLLLELTIPLSYVRYGSARGPILREIGTAALRESVLAPCVIGEGRPPIIYLIICLLSTSASRTERLGRPIRRQMRARRLNMTELPVHHSVAIAVSFDGFFASEGPALPLDVQLTALTLRRHFLIVHGVEDQIAG